MWYLTNFQFWWAPVPVTKHGQIWIARVDPRCTHPHQISPQLVYILLYNYANLTQFWDFQHTPHHLSQIWNVRIDLWFTIHLHSKFHLEWFIVSPVRGETSNIF